MEGVLKFNLDDPDDAEAFKRVNKSLNMALVLSEFANSRKGIEYLVEEMTTEEAVQRIYAKFFELLEDHYINLEEIIS